MLVSAEDVDVASGAHVPDAGDAISTSCDEDIECGVESEGVDTGQVAVVVADHFVGFQVPAFDHFVFGAGEEVRVPWRHGQAAYCGYVACECQA